MPTAVERLFDSFLKLDGIGEQRRLNEAFLKIDNDLLKLSNANADSFLKIEHEPSLKIDLAVIGDGFLKLSHDFLKLDTAIGLADGSVLKLAGLPGSVDTGPGADFVVLDHKVSASAADLKILGTDFLKLDTSPTAEAFQLKLDGIANDFLKLSGDMAADRDAFLKLSVDFLRLGGGGDHLSPLDLAYKEFGGELATVAGAFDTLSTDFLKLDQAMHGSGGGAGVPNAAGGGGGAGMPIESAGGGGGSGFGPVGGALMTLYQDFHALGHALEELGEGAATVIHDLSHHDHLAGGGGGSGHS